MPQSPSSSLRIGTRGSKLARFQAELVQRLLKENAGIACELVIVKTSGDRILDRPLADAGGKGLFTKELEEALLRQEIDLAVHSMKDVPVQIPAGLKIAALLPREDARDAFLSPKAKTLQDLSKGAVIGTSSVRRKAQVMRARPDLEIRLLRGNVDTRLAKLDAGTFDAILLAMAGLKRLGLAARVTSILPLVSWLPALAQGAIGIETRDDNVAKQVAPLNDETTAIALACERAFQASLDGSCRTSIGGYAKVEKDRLMFEGEVLAPDGSAFAGEKIDVRLSGDFVVEAARLGREAGLTLKPRVAQWLAL
ncbi:MAG: hydroxymethylbilane synthase [Proteobacteria bacterium]|nr:hydroxymethylbilane synthase [Pseudomonadota bacterium]